MVLPAVCVDDCKVFKKHYEVSASDVSASDVSAIFAVFLARWFGFIPAILLWILYILLSLPVREEELELKVIGMAFFLLSLIPISILMKMLIAL